MCYLAVSYWNDQKRIYGGSLDVESLDDFLANIVINIINPETDEEGSSVLLDSILVRSEEEFKRKRKGVMKNLFEREGIRKLKTKRPLKSACVKSKGRCTPFPRWIWIPLAGKRPIRTGETKIAGGMYFMFKGDKKYSPGCQDDLIVMSGGLLLCYHD